MQHRVISMCCTPACQVSDKISPEDLTTMIDAFNPDNLPGRLAVVVRMGAAKLRAHLPTLVHAVEASGQVGHVVMWLSTVDVRSIEVVTQQKGRTC